MLIRNGRNSKGEKFCMGRSFFLYLFEASLFRPDVEGNYAQIGFFTHQKCLTVGLALFFTCVVVWDGWAYPYYSEFKLENPINTKYGFYPLE